MNKQNDEFDMQNCKQFGHFFAGSVFCITILLLFLFLLKLPVNNLLLITPIFGDLFIEKVL